MLDNLTKFASFVSQFTPMKVVFCQKKDNHNDYNDDNNDNYQWRQEFEGERLKHFLHANRLKYI